MSLKSLNCLLGCLASAFFLNTALPAQTNVLTQHNDIGRTGLNSTETVLTPANVGSGAFGKLYTVPLDGRAVAQPLYVSALSINGVQHSVVFVATQHDSVYALDAGASGHVLWYASLLDAAHGAAPGATTVPISNTGCPDSIGPEYGITGTPVIDLATGTLYVVSKTLEGTNPYPVQRIHALDITTGNEKFSGPATISATVPGVGNGSVGGQLSFDPKWENQRPGLLFVNNTVYIAWGSHCDFTPWHGWLMGYSAASGTLQQTKVLATSPNGSGSGIWLSGIGLAADQNGPGGSPRMFVATGNGDYDGQTEWGESVLNLNLAASSLAVTDSFTASNLQALNTVDYDIGSAGTLILPDAAGTAAHPHLALQLSKEGVMYLLDRENLGGYNASADHVLQEVVFGTTGYGLWGGPAYFNGNVYFWPANSNMAQYSLTNGALSSTPVAVNAYQEPGTNTGYYNGTFLGASPSVSANGVSNGIVWANDFITDKGTPTQVLFAFDASNVAKTIWSSPRFSATDGAGTSQKFGIPTIADGRVYLAGANELNVFGLLPAPLVSLIVTPNSTAMAAGATQQFIATGVYSDSSTQDLTSIVTWTSSGAAATISSSGLATGVAQGSTTITASLGSFTSAPISLYVNGVFPNTSVGSGSAAQNVYFTFAGTTNLAATPWVVLTAGVPNLDFQAAVSQPANVCQTGHTYHAGDECMVSVVFNPTTPGLRAGAVQLIAIDNTPAGTSYINGVGVGPALAFTPGIISTLAGNGTPGYLGDNGQATGAEMSAPTGVTMDGAGNLYIADSQNNRVRKVSPTGAITTVAGTGTAGYSGDNNPAISATLNGPRGVALDGAGNLYISDTNNNVVRQVSTTGIITTIAGTGTLGYIGYGGPATTAQLASPYGLTVDGGGNLYIADSGNSVVRKVTPSGLITTVAGVGISGYSGNGGSATRAELASPNGVAVDTAGNLYIADSGNNVIRKVNAGGTITTIVGNGTSGYLGDGGAATSAELASPAGVAIDTAGNLYIADTANAAVREVSTTGTINTVAGYGLSAYTGDAGPATYATLNGPTSVAVSGLGNMYIADAANNVVRKVNVSSSALALAAIAGQTGTPQSILASNIGDATLNFSAFSISSNFVLETGTNLCALATPLLPGASCLLDVALAPAASGPSITGSLTLADNAPLSPQSVSLSGSGLEAVTINTSPSGLQVSIDGKTAQTAPVTVGWQVGSKHTLAITSPQVSTGTRDIFTGWSDGTTTATDSITVTAATTTYTANFNAYYLLSTFVTPAGFGTLTPSLPSPTGDGYYLANTPLTLTATSSSSANPFSNWAGSITSTSNPLSITMTSPISETGNFGSNPGASGVPPLAYEPFGETSGTPLSGISGGGDSGWAAPWVQQTGELEVPGYQIASASPLTFTGLATTANYAIGGYGYQSAGRQLNVASTGPFNAYLANGLIGASGQTIWLSFLLREDADPTNGQINAVFLTPDGGIGAWIPQTGIGIGYFGTGPYWGLQLNNGTPILSTVPVVQGQTVFMVASITFGATNQINLYINPTSLGGTAPATPSAQLTTAASVAFQSLSYLGGYETNVSSLGDIRFGVSYGAVTPTTQTTQTAQTITFTAPTSPVTYPVAPITLSATAGSGLPVTFSIISGPGSISGNTLTVTGAGTIVIAANQAGNSTYAPAPQVTQSVVVNLASQTITFTAPTSPVTYPVAPVTLSATASSGLPVTFSVSSGPGSVTGNTLTVTGAGTIVIAANQAGNTTYAPATQVTQSIVVNLASQTIIFTAPASPVTYPVSPVTLSANATSGLPVTFSIVSGPGSISGNTLTVTGTGTIVIAANQPGNSTYAPAAQVTQSIVVNAGSLTSQAITFTAPTSPVTYPVSPIALSATATSGLPVTFSIVSGPGSISGNTLTVSGTGTIVIAANQAGNSTYAPAAQVTHSIVVNAGSLSSQAITFTAPASPVTYPVSPIILSATATSGLPVTFSIVSGPGSISGNTLTVTGTGTIVIAANQAGNSSYAAAPQVTQTIVVNASGGTSSGTVLAYEPFGETSGIPLSGANGGGDSGWAAPWVEQFNETAEPGYQISSASPLTYTGLATTTSYAIGGYGYQTAGRQLNVASTSPFTGYLANGLIGASGQTIWLSFLLREDANPNNGQINAIFLVPNNVPWVAQTGIGIGYFGASPYWGLQLNNGTPILSAVPVVQGQTVLMVASITFGATNQINLYVNPASLGGTAPASPSAQLITAASVAFQSLSYLGGYQANVSSLGDIRFGTSYASVTPTTGQVTQTSQTITFTAPTSPVTYPVAPITLSATASSGLPVTFSIVSGPGSISGNTLTVTGTGTIVIAANQSGNGTYAPAAQVTQSIVVNAGSLSSQTITFTAPTSPVTYPVAPITLSATATSGLQVTFSLVSGPGSISGNTLTVTGTGTIVIGANQAGNSTYAPATQVKQSIVVNAGSLASQTITFTAPTSPVTYPVAPITLSATASSGLPVTFSLVSGPGSISGNTLTVTGTGTIVIAANQAGNSTYAPATQVTQSIVVNAAGVTSSGTLLAYEPFNETSGTPLSGASGGGDSGWKAAWVEQTNETNEPGYQIASANPLTYPGLAPTVNYAIGGYGYESAGRQLNVDPAGPFSSYLSSGLIGTSGQTIWLSFLLREDANPNNGEINAIFLSPQHIAWLAQNGIGIGYFGNSPYWGLQLNNGTPVLSTVPVVQGQTVLLVASITFGTTNQINLYVNPTPGNAAPSSSSAQLTTLTNVGFQSLAYLGGYTSNISSLAAIRFGSTYAAVTPTTQTALSTQTITFTAPASPVTYPVAPITLSATATSGLPVTLSVISGPGSLTGNTLTVNGTGTIVIAANQSGNSSYAPAPQVTQSIVVNAGSLSSQTITFTAPASPVTYPVAPITLSATATSGLPVTLSVMSGPGSVTGNTLTVTGTGTIVIAANQSGNSSYAPAPQVTQSIVVNPSNSTSSGTVLAYEPFGEASGTPLNGAAGSGDSGWNGAWVEQEGSTASPGYQTASTNPLTYSGLLTTSNYAIGGYGYQTAGRQLNTAASGPFLSYLSSGLIGAPGQTLWLSFLLREDANPNNGEINAIYLTPNNIPWLTQNGIGIGYFGTSLNWGLQLNNGTPVLSTVPVIQGQTVLLVVSITFGATNQVNLYVNPALGGSAPATPSTQLTTASTIAFQSLAYLGGYTASESSLAAIRFGTSFAAVTPAP